MDAEFPLSEEANIKLAMLYLYGTNNAQLSLTALIGWELLWCVDEYDADPTSADKVVRL